MSRKRNSSLAAIAAGLAVSLTLAACSGGGDGDGGDEAVTLTFANWQWLEPGRGEALWEAMLAYTDSHPNVTLEQQAVPRADYESTMSTQIGAGTGPDLLIVPPAFFYQAADAEILAPIDGVLSAESEAALLPSNDRGVYDGEQLAYTWEAVNWALIYNTELLDAAGGEVPTTPEELLVTAEEITAATGNPGFTVRHLSNEMYSWWVDFSSWPCGFGGGWASDGELTIDSPENIAAVELLKELYDSGAMPIGDDASTFRNRFAAGEIGMMIDNASTAFTVTSGEDTTMSSDTIGVAPLPFPTNDSSQNVNFIGINAGSDNIAAAEDFIAWLFDEEGQAFAADGVFPSTVGTDAQPSDEVLSANPWVQTYREQAITSTCSPLVPGFELQTTDLSTIVMTQIETVLTQDRSAERALQQAQQEAESQVG